MADVKEEFFLAVSRPDEKRCALTPSTNASKERLFSQCSPEFLVVPS
jgi:hypothetical protein